MHKPNVVDINSPEFENKVWEILSKKGIKMFCKDGWYKDAKTQLEWGPTSSKAMNLKEANEYCEALGGRLPTVDELQTILDRTLYNPACDQKLFPDVKSEWYWSSTKYMGFSGASFVVSFGSGLVDDRYEGRKYYVRPVLASQ